MARLETTEVRPDALQALSEGDLLSTWQALEAELKSKIEANETVENTVNAALFMLDEFERRSMEQPQGALAELAHEFRERVESAMPDCDLADVVVVRDFVSIVGSTATGKEAPNDLDVLVRADFDQDKQCFMVRQENITLPIRNTFSPDKEKKIQFIDNPQGAHGDFIPMFDLVLRARKYPRPHVVKELPKKLSSDIVFVVCEANAIEKARGEFLVGQDGSMFLEKYLTPMHLSKRDVAIIDVSQIELLDEMLPRLVVALGKVAKTILGDKATLYMPHPSAVRRFGDSGELARKVKKYHHLAKQERPDDEGGETHGGAAQANWEQNWHDMLPTTGCGRFVYQHHWRGLEEGETPRSDEWLSENTEHSLHGDIRLEGANGLWGWAVFLAGSKDTFIDAQPGEDTFQLAPKLEQPKEWLDVGVRSPLVIEPGGVGSTSQKFSKFFAKDTGTYELGIATQHGLEVFLNGDKLKGRYLFQFAPIGDARVWLLSKPEDQTPAMESKELDDVMQEEKEKGRKFLFWGGPGEPSKKLSTETGDPVEVSKMCNIVKADKEKQIVYSVVLDPYIFDAHDDMIPPADVEATAHGWLEKSRMVGLNHAGQAKATVVESFLVPYPTPQDYQNAMAMKAHKAYKMPYGSDKVHSGTWVVGFRLDDQLWQMVQNGELNAVSIGGFGSREPIKQDAVPEVEIVELIESRV